MKIPGVNYEKIKNRIWRDDRYDFKDDNEMISIDELIDKLNNLKKQDSHVMLYAVHDRYDEEYYTQMQPFSYQEETQEQYNLRINREEETALFLKMTEDLSERAVIEKELKLLQDLADKHNFNLNRK